jgi:hypothetical protein
MYEPMVESAREVQEAQGTLCRECPSLSNNRPVETRKTEREKKKENVLNLLADQKKWQ